MPEFEGVPEAYCRRALEDAVAARSHTVVIGTLLGLVSSGVGAISLALIARTWWVSLPLRFQTAYDLHFTVLGTAAGIFVVAFGAAIGRDLGKRHALLTSIRRCRCPKCSYPLMGIPIWHNGLGAPVPGTATIRCPECGFQGNLLEMGLTPNELIPYQERTVPSNVGEFHRRYRAR